MAGLAVIVVNYRTPELTVRCIASVEAVRARRPDLTMVVVDGHSQDASVTRISAAIDEADRRDWITLLPLEVNGGFAFANNRAIAELARRGPLPDAILLINPDAYVRDGAVEAMAALLAREPAAGAVGALLIHEDGRRQASAFRFPSLRGEFCRGARTALLERLLRVRPVRVDLDSAGEVPWVTGAAVMLRTAALDAAGAFDEGFFLYFEETELMLRLRRAGWTVWHEPAAHVVHEGGAATQIRDPATGLPTARRLPRYWYESRRRYFTLAHGRGHAVASGLAWLAGRGIWQLRQAIRRRPDDGALRAAGDMLDYGLWPRAADRVPATFAPSAAGSTALPEQPAWATAA